MIKANEVRIGIWLQYQKSKPFKVTTDLLMDHRFWEDIDQNIEPIPLTPEWLERCGLELRKEDKIWQIQVGNTSYLEIEAEEPFMCGVTPETWRDICPIYIWNEIKHVHQLQNLYFALTGEELTIKS